MICLKKYKPVFASKVSFVGIAVFLLLFFLPKNLDANVGEKNEQFFFSEAEKLAFLYHSRKSLSSKILIPYDHPLVTKFRNRYLSENGLIYLQTIMQRSLKYRSFIIEEIRKENLPIELLFLPVIESGFSTRATSKSGAVGVWQFMRNSIGGYDIHINEWVDERRDPWKTSIAAINKLKWNYSYFKDWHLALAAYNCGVGALNRAIKKAGSSNYWYLAEKGYLKKETALYVPKFLAITQILMQSEKYGIDWGLAWENSATETMQIDRAVDLIFLAEKLELDDQILLELNPALKFNITPSDINYQLRLPVGYKDAVAKLLEENTILIKYYTYTVKSGDTLYALSKHYGVSINAILGYNPSVKARNLQVGKKLLIPALKSVPTYRRKRKESIQKFSGKHAIQKGDTLWSIALKYEVQVEDLAEQNNLSVNSILSLGQTLKVPIQE